MSSRFSREFKQEAVRLSRLDDRTCVEVAEELEFNVENLYRWRREARDDGEHAFPGKGKQTPEEAEISRIKAKLRQVEQERDILKKAVSIFAE